jgi:heat-inducible transcriptional repressor
MRSHQTLQDWIPDPRGQAILSAIIEKYLITGEPVGSRTISSRFANSTGWSSATIRNVMAELEEAGLVDQPHTSAGRVPTDKGYRFYVDNIIGDARLSKADMMAINKTLGLPYIDVEGTSDRLLEKISHLLSEISESVGIVISPSLADTRLQHIEFVLLSEGRVLVIIVSSPNTIQNKIIRVDETLSQEDLEQTARYLNTEFSGKTLLAIRAEILKLMQAEQALYDKLLRNAVLLWERSLEGEDTEIGDVYIDGAINILTKPDFSDVERLRELFHTLKEKSRLVKILNECIARDRDSGNVRVVIGREHIVPSMRNCALITASYHIGADAVGTIGVVGPMRIEYARMIAVVRYVAQLVEGMLDAEPAALSNQ